MTNWRQERHPADAHRARRGGRRCAAGWRSEPDLQLLDVRERREWDAGHVPGSLFTAVARHHRDSPGIDPTRPIAVICAGGVRAATAASLLKHHGAQDVIHVVDGGVPSLAGAGVQLQSSPEPPAGVLA